MRSPIRPLIDWIIRHPLPVLGVSAVGVGLSALAASRVEVDYSVEQFFPTWGEERMIFDEYRAIFPGEDAQVAFFLATPGGLDQDGFRTLRRVSETFHRHDLEEVRWIGSELAADTTTSTADLRATVAAARGRPLLEGVLWNADGTVAVVQGRLPTDMNHDAGRRSLVPSLTEEIEEIDPAHRWVLSGTPVLRAQIPELLEVDQTVLLGGGILLFFVLLFAFFRHVGIVFIALAAVAPAYVVTLAVMALTDHPVTILTSFIPIVILVVGICDTTHILEHWRRARGKGVGPAEAVGETFEGLAVSCFFTSVTTALGFASLAATGIGIVSDFGLFTALAVMTTFLFMVTVLPALLARVRAQPPAPREAAAPARVVVRFARGVLHRRTRWVIPAFAAVGLASLALGSTLQIQTYLVDDLKEDATIMQDLRWVEEAGFGLFQTNLFIRADAADLLEAEMVDWMERFQAEVASESLVLGSYGLPDARRSSPIPLARVADRIPSWMYRPDRDATQVVVTVVDAGSSATLAFLDRMDAYLAANPPPAGTAELTGTVRMAHSFSSHVLRSFGPSILLALALIWGVMSLLFRSVRTGLLAMVPNVFPLVVLSGVMALLGVALKPSTILVFSIAFGIAVDDSIHLMTRFRHLLSQGATDRSALDGALGETGPALVMSTVVVAAGFSLLLLSQFELLYLLGLLTAVTAVSALAADLLIFPALIEAYAHCGGLWSSRLGPGRRWNRSAPASRAMGMVPMSASTRPPLAAESRMGRFTVRRCTPPSERSR